MGNEIWGGADQMTAAEVLSLFQDGLPESIETASSLDICKAVIQYLYDRGHRHIAIAQGVEFSEAPFFYPDSVIFKNNNIFYAFVPPNIETNFDGLFLKDRSLKAIKQKLSTNITRNEQDTIWAFPIQGIAEIKNGQLKYGRGSTGEHFVSLDFTRYETLILDPTFVPEKFSISSMCKQISSLIRSLTPDQKWIE